MSSLPRLPYVSAEEYLESERKADFRSEYVDGQVFAMSGTTWEHNQIVSNIYRELGLQLKDGPCQVVGLDLKVRVNPAGPYFYPDLVVVCGEPELEDMHRDILLDAKIVIEVLSPSTEPFDRGTKFEMYRQLKSLEQYILISQNRVLVEHFVLQPNGHWDYSTVTTRDGIVELPAIGAQLQAGEIYGRVKVG